VFFSTGWFALWGILIALAGVIAFFIKEHFEKKAILLLKREKGSTTFY
jgi:hypothetical protein